MGRPRIYGRPKTEPESFICGMCELGFWTMDDYERLSSAHIPVNMPEFSILASNAGLVAKEANGTSVFIFRDLDYRIRRYTGHPPGCVLMARAPYGLQLNRHLYDSDLVGQTGKVGQKHLAFRHSQSQTVPAMDSTTSRFLAHRNARNAPALPVAVPHKLQMVLDASHRKRTLWASEKTCGLYNVMFAMPGAMPLCALASYPGSGNTWTRYLIEAASGIFTGSIYKDQQLYMSGYYGELMDWKSGATIVQKTHDCGENHIQDFGSCGVLLLRNPYRAILSFHNYLFGGHTGYAKISNYRRKDWPKFVHLQARHWLEIAVNWTNKAQNLHVVHYENLKEDSSNSLKDILKFRSLVTDERRLNCIKKNMSKSFFLGKIRDREKFIFCGRIIRNYFLHNECRNNSNRNVIYAHCLLWPDELCTIPLKSYEFYYTGASSSSPVVPLCGRESQLDCRLRSVYMSIFSRPVARNHKSSEEMGDDVVAAQVGETLVRNPAGFEASMSVFSVVVAALS
ncbi:unnamed protein product, partial [Meganyctiphanes norvegica]